MLQFGRQSNCVLTHLPRLVSAAEQSQRARAEHSTANACVMIAIARREFRMLAGLVERNACLAMSMRAFQVPDDEVGWPARMFGLYHKRRMTCFFRESYEMLGGLARLIERSSSPI